MYVCIYIYIINVLIVNRLGAICEQSVKNR